MKGSISLRTDRKNPYWIVSWPHQGKVYKITRYLGEPDLMYQRHPDKKRDIGFKKAEKLLALMQGDEERGCLRIEKYTGGRLTDTVPYLEAWLEAREPNLTPGGYTKYRTAVKNYLVPFFEQNPVMLHEIQYDTVVKLMNWIKGSGKHKKNVVDTLKCCLRYAWKSQRIMAVPPFPEAKLYDIKKNPPEWLPRARFNAVMKHIAPEHKPIYMWLYLHLRRPGEACALLAADYDKASGIFTIRRGISNGRIVERTKTGDIHEIPCAEAFIPYIASLPEIRKYFFTCRESKSEGKRYTEKLLRKYWKKACEKAGEDIDVYRGTKTTRASQMVNEEGVNMSDLQIAGDWASMTSVASYARANVARRKAVLDGKVITLKSGGRVGEENGGNK